MTVISINVPKIMDEEIDALIKRGYYDNKSEIFREAIRELFAKNQNLRISAVVELYEQGKKIKVYYGITNEGNICLTKSYNRAWTFK